MADKEQIKADAKKRAAEQEAAIEAKQEHLAAQRQAADEAIKGGKAVQEMPVTPAAEGAREEYGPYEEPRVVPTSQGENQVPFRKVLFFVPTEVFDTRINRMVTRMEPTHRDATPDEMAPILAKRAAKKKAKLGVA